MLLVTISNPNILFFLIKKIYRILIHHILFFLTPIIYINIIIIKIIIFNNTIIV